MAFTFDPTTKRGKVRLLLGDTDTATPANQIFTDAEIDSFLDLGGQEILRAAAFGADSIAANTARSAIAWRSALGQRLDRTKVPQFYQRQAESWREEAKQGTPAEEIHSVVYEIDRFGGRTADFIGDNF